MDTVFNAFPNAVISGVWSIGTHQRGTVLGNTYTKYGDIDVIISEGQDASYGSAPNAEVITTDLLLYVKPSQLPTTNLRELAASAIVTDGSAYFEIVNASAGKNQETGELEHIELAVRQTEIVDVEG